MLTELKKREVLYQIAEMEKLVVLDDSDKTLRTIKEMAERAEEASAKLTASTDTVMPVIRTVMVINWREKVAAAKLRQVETALSEIRSLTELKRVIDCTDPLTFCRTYLGINTKKVDYWKHVLLKGLTEGLLAYQARHGIATEIEAVRHWAKHVDVGRVKEDSVGKAKFVGPGVVGNIRLNLGIDTVKPDRHVIGVVDQVLQLDVKPILYGDLAVSLGLGKKYFDEILFRYGQAKRISA